MSGTTSAAPLFPSAIDSRSSKAGLRAVATFEALKGALVVLLGATLLAVHSHLQDFAESLLYHLHIDFDRRMAHMLLNAASTISDLRLWVIVLAVGTYAMVRFIEAWGLWHQRVWAEWFALLSGALYLPWELLKVAERADWDRVAVFLINLLVVGYMLMIRFRETRGARRDAAAEASGAV